MLEFSAKDERLEMEGDAPFVDESLRGVCNGVFAVDDGALVLIGCGLPVDVDIDPARDELIGDDDVRRGSVAGCVFCGSAITSTSNAPVSTRSPLPAAAAAAAAAATCCRWKSGTACNAWLFPLGSDMIRRRRPAILVLHSVRQPPVYSLAGSDMHVKERLLCYLMPAHTLVLPRR